MHITFWKKAEAMYLHISSSHIY